MKGKKVYAFGDSIIYGHTDPDNAFMNMIERETGIELIKCAVNGATVSVQEGEDNNILNQLANAPDEKPDLIIFDGYTNDALPEVGIMDKLGSIKGKNGTDFDEATFCGGFEKILWTMKSKWGDTPIVFVTIHKSAGRKWDVQTKLLELALKMCNEWGIEVADVFEKASLDTRNEDEMQRYIMGGAGSHPNIDACREFYVPIVKAKIEEVLNQE